MTQIIQPDDFRLDLAGGGRGADPPSPAIPTERQALASLNTGGAREWLHRDSLASNKLISDQAGARVQRSQYLTFGDRSGGNTRRQLSDRQSRTPGDKLASHYLASVRLASIMTWLRTFGDTT